MTSIRSYLALVEAENDLTFIDTAPVLLEGFVLTEGPLADRIKATMQRVGQKAGDVQYALLAKTTAKALDMFQADAQTSGVLRKIQAAGRLAASNPALLTALVGIAGTLIGMASNPASAAQAAAQIDPVVSGNIDHIIDQLAQSGIHVDMAASLPPEIQGTAAKAAKALKAIQGFEFTHGSRIESSREVFTSVSLDATVQHQGSSYIEHITVRTPDGKIVLGQIDTAFTVVDGKVEISDHESGVKFDLAQAFKGLSPEQQKAVGAYLDGSVWPQGSSSSGPEAILKDKAPDLSLAVATAALAKGSVASRVRIGPQGVKVGERASGAAD